MSCGNVIKGSFVICGEEGNYCSDECVPHRIKINRAQCLKCSDVIESRHVHDFVYCSCKALAVDGGRDYLRRVFDKEAWVEMSEYEDA